MQHFYIRIREKAFEEISHLSKRDYRADQDYEVLGSIGEQLLIVGEGNELLTLYPRWCEFVRKSEPIVRMVDIKKYTNI